MKPNFNYPPQQLDLNTNLDAMPPLYVHPNLNVQTPTDLSSLPEAGQAAPSIFQANAAPADRFAGVNAASRGNNVIPDLPVSAARARRVLKDAGIDATTAAQWRDTAQAQWEDQTGRRSAEAAALARSHDAMTRFLIDHADKETSEEEDAKK